MSSSDGTRRRNTWVSAVEPASRKIVMAVLFGSVDRTVPSSSARSMAANEGFRKELIQAVAFLGIFGLELVAVHHDAPRRGCVGGRRGLGHDPHHPVANLAEAGVRLVRLMLKVGDELPLPIIENGQEQLALAPKVLVKSLVRQPGLTDDVTDLGIRRLQAVHHGHGSADQPGDLVDVRRVSTGQRPFNRTNDERSFRVAQRGDGRHKDCNCRPLSV